jgi:glycosyltransferase involved in cell wall biosynthesis
VTVLFGHPTGPPNAHHAALAHFEAGRLEAFCVTWVPSVPALTLLSAIPPLEPMAGRLARRRFEPLAEAPKIQGRLGEWRRLLLRACGSGHEGFSYEANDWLMRTMAREVGRVSVTAVHSYEDCSLWQFEEAKRHGKACIYDMPIGYYDAWEETMERLARTFADWLPAGGLPPSAHVRPEQKRREMELADLVLMPSSFALQSLLDHCPAKKTVMASYGVDTAFWSPAERPDTEGPLRFIYAGQVSLRKGIPDLIDAWEKADLRDAELELVGQWTLADGKKRALPPHVTSLSPLAPTMLRERYRASHVFVFPSYFEGYGLVLAEAMACGLPAIASTATAAPDFIDELCVRLVEPGDVDGLVEALRWAADHRDSLAEMGRAARRRAEQLTWERYRESVTSAVTPYV